MTSFVFILSLALAVTLASSAEVMTGEERGPVSGVETSFVPEEFTFQWDRPSIKEFVMGEAERSLMAVKVGASLNAQVAETLRVQDQYFPRMDMKTIFVCF